MREQFSQTILLDGRIGLEIRTPRDIQEGSAGHDLLPDGVFLEKSAITPLLLHMLAEAYHAGYLAAVDDGQEAIRRLVYENRAHRKPAPKITDTLDYRKQGADRP